LDARLVVLHPRAQCFALRVDERLACLSLDAHGRCRLHAGGHKPRPCTRFPYVLAATPEGGRVGTVHRCTCRTLRGAAALDLDDAARSLADRSGRLLANVRVGPRVRLTDRTTMSFGAYRAMEARLLDALAAGAPPLEALGFGGSPASLLRATSGFAALG